MIDDKTLAQWEAAALDDDHDSYAEVFRFARRYLALRDEAKTKEGRIRVQAIFWNMGSRKELDAAADRLHVFPKSPQSRGCNVF